MTKNWKSIAEAKNAETNAKIPREWLIPVPHAKIRDVTGYVSQFLTPAEITITESTAHELVGKLAYGKYSSLEVTKAFCHRAAIAHQLIFFDKASKRAQELDDYFHEYKKTSGPLHGLPVSLKDNVRIEGEQTTIGYVGWIGKNDTSESEALVTKILRNAGAVFYVKTSVPSGLMSGETVNNIVGYTWNPKNRLLSSGGSSGGEGALIAIRGSPMGVGSDLAGSIRIPAGATGIFGLKPSCGRLPYKNVAQSPNGQETVGGVVGPMTNSIADARLFVQTILEAEPWKHDPGVIELKWRPLEEDETREHAKRGLSFAVIEWTPPSHKVANSMLLEALSADGGAHTRRNHALSGEQVLPQIAASFSTTLGSLHEKSMTELWDLHVRKLTFQNAYQTYWNSTASLTNTGRPVDALILPWAPSASYPPEKFCYLGYSGFVNLLDYTASVVPVGVKVDKSIDRKAVGHEPVDALDKFVYESYDPEAYHGTPIGIQIVGRRLQEEKVLVISEIVEAALKA
ncbi:amidase signature domain-containing protein [Tuber indicum]|nr:amidase signature domain-containing protein [Tuber indicum]